ncbi:MAG: deoxyribose-phosphate aldolase, partial [Calditrichota bacterium]
MPQDIARCIDHTLLKPDASENDIRKLCEEALQYQFASVCVNPTYVMLAADILRGSPVRVCSVVGFPFGTHSPEIKAMETRQAIRNGAREIDMVINIGALKSGVDDLLFRDIRAVVEACEDGAALSKVMIEAALLTDDEKVKACQSARKAKANYVKTSTGFG